MINADTKKLLDLALKIIVSKIYDPKTQLEQIILAIIYKIINDNDERDKLPNGERLIFSGDYAKYSWDKLLSSTISSYERVSLYSEALSKIGENPNISPLRKEIFKNVILPYNDPEILLRFLNIINEFKSYDVRNYKDVYEYLLSTLSSKGIMGQFRTPVHIADFIVAILEPQKDEITLDPACGSGGFLISAYKRVLTNNTDDNGEVTLNSAEISSLTRNIIGYDISPEMTRLSLINLFFHDFKEAQIFEYDTLKSEARWNERADVILANPPYITPTGGIRAHNLFKMKVNKAEVLFIEYILNHLNEAGRAGIIVPDSVIYDRNVDYLNIRKALVEDCLIAVISLPAGAFLPHTRVKTSILVLDKKLAELSDFVAFFDIKNDGFAVSVNRTPISLDDIPDTLRYVKTYKENIRASADFSDHNSNDYQLTPKSEILTHPNYSLFAPNYKDNDNQKLNYLVPFAKVCSLELGAKFSVKHGVSGPYPIIGSGGVLGFHNNFIVKGPAILISRFSQYFMVKIITENCVPTRACYYVKINDENLTNFKYLFYALNNIDFKPFMGGTVIPALNKEEVYRNIQIPLPPIAIQKQIAAELDCYRDIIDNAQNIVNKYRKTFTVDRKWEKVKLNDISAISSDIINPSVKFANTSFGYINIGSINNLNGKIVNILKIMGNNASKLTALSLKPRDILFSTINPLLKTCAYLDDIDQNTVASRRLAVVRTVSDKIIPYFLYLSLITDYVAEQLDAEIMGSTIKNITLRMVKAIDIYIPPLPIQRQIIADIKRETAIVARQEDTVAHFEDKISRTLEFYLTNKC
ncbi:MAG: N-6 DNA methylase [Deltaproteobacteria bacterium]|nr:N-6 DNA methylase [Deltaproteobacteria bacterium]